MRLSKAFLKTYKESPKEAELASHQLMLRTSMIKQLTRGVYSYLPLGYRVLRKIENITREEMNRAGAQEIHMYEKSSTPNSTEVKIMINHGKENLKRGVY